MSTVYFDMDGTTYDLYGQPEWLERITVREDATVYAAPNACLLPYNELRDLLTAIVAAGHKVGIISWLSYGSSKEYDIATRAAKRSWLSYYMPEATEIHLVKYGTPKHHVCNDKQGAIIVDDNEQVCKKWTRGIAIDGSKPFTQAVLDALGIVCDTIGTAPMTRSQHHA